MFVAAVDILSIDSPAIFIKSLNGFISSGFNLPAILPALPAHAVNDDALTVGEAVDVNLEDTTEKKDNYYTVVSGDNLSKIAKAMYGDANKYNHIFEANKPMLNHPDKIYPGQVLAIPTLA